MSGSIGLALLSGMNAGNTLLGLINGGAATSTQAPLGICSSPPVDGV